MQPNYLADADEWFIRTPYVAEFRYPGQRLEPPAREARTAYQYATDILKFVRDALANATPPSN
jgi:hypothetical protein